MKRTYDYYTGRILNESDTECGMKYKKPIRLRETESQRLLAKKKLQRESDEIDEWDDLKEKIKERRLRGRKFMDECGVEECDDRLKSRKFMDECGAEECDDLKKRVRRSRDLEECGVEECDDIKKRVRKQREIEECGDDRYPGFREKIREDRLKSRKFMDECGVEECDDLKKRARRSRDLEECGVEECDDLKKRVRRSRDLEECGVEECDDLKKRVRRSRDLEECGVEECDDFKGRVRRKKDVTECDDFKKRSRRLKDLEESDDYDQDTMKKRNPYMDRYIAYRLKYMNDRPVESVTESVHFNDIIENPKADITSVSRLNRILFRDTNKPIAIWEYSGNRVMDDIEDICNEVGIDACIISARELYSSSDDVVTTLNALYHGEKVFVIDNFTKGTAEQVETLLSALEQLDPHQVTIVVIGRISTNPNNDLVADRVSKKFINYVYTPTPDNEDAVDVDDEMQYESVATRFAKYRKLYESDDETEGTDTPEDADEADEDTAKDKDDKSAEKPAEDSDDTSSAEDETEDVPMTAIVLTVKKDDVDRCKEELADAGIPEDAITDIDDDEDSENGKIKIDADYALELKDYLAGKGIDLEEKIGGEIIDDTEEKTEDKEVAADDEEEMDFDKEFGDIFGDDDESAQ